MMLQLLKSFLTDAQLTQPWPLLLVERLLHRPGALTHNDCLWLRCGDVLLALWQQQERLDAACGGNSLCIKQTVVGQHATRHVATACRFVTAAVPQVPQAANCC
jgi:hypothetical protein